ncbi:MAG: metallophosphoesterase [Gammaproteobacteria bacterium]|nr:metallophosphoesterase [Gammaproteobacteria bacterium]MDH5650599.1 metallophosphoesterase [Gammaproteobacteria bacterium]
MNNKLSAIIKGEAGAWRRLLGVWLVVFAMFTGLAACGGGSTEGDGELSIALTDAEGDFVSYAVDVVSLTLTKANGTVVQVLPVKTRVDFARYTDMTEFLTIATIPAGDYIKGSMVLDYRNAEILVENAAGQPVTVSADQIKDGSGNVVTTMEMSVQLEGRNHLVILPGVPAHLTLDFDLKQSNAVNFTGGVPDLTVQPFLLAEVNAEHNKPHRLRGPLKQVQVENGTFQLFVRPFLHYINRNSLHHFGVLRVNTDADTIFEIDGVIYQGSAGMAVLATMSQYSAVTVMGDLRHLPRRLTARMVYAGSSVPGGNLDVIQGSVTARTGDVLTVKGITFTRNNGAITFNDSVQVSLDNSTTVLKALNLGTFNKDDVSVGQFVTIFGTLSGAPGNHTLNAANGYARMELSWLRASRVGVVFIPENPPPYQFVLNVNRINGRDIAQFDFTGTGLDAANDADPTFYEVNEGALNVSAVQTDAAVLVRGHVTPFGSAPADFDAVTVINTP